MCKQKDPDPSFKPDLRYRELQEIQSDTDFNKGVETKRWLFERRLEYARAFFAHHAKQRMDMFNYFLVFAGFALAAFANIFKDGHYGTSTIVAVLSALLTIVFMFLDRRNEELVHISEDVLEALEFDLLFANYNRLIVWPRRRRLWGCMPKERSERPLGIFRRQTADITGTLSDRSAPDEKSNPQTVFSRGESWYAHGTWLPIFQLGVLSLFCCLAIVPWRFTILALSRSLIHRL